MQADHDRVQVQYWLPVLSEDVQTDVPSQINVRVVDLWRGVPSVSYKTPRVVWVSYTHLVLALDLWRFMGVVGIDLECE